MKSMSKGIRAIVVLGFVVVAAVVPSFGQSYPPGVYYSEQNTNWPPLPAPPPGLAVYSLGGDKYLYNDTAVDYSASAPVASSSSRFSSFTLTSEDDASPDYMPFGFTTNDFYIELTGFSTNTHLFTNVFGTNIVTNIFVLLRLHGTVSNELYQLESSTLLATPAKFWTPGEIITGSTSNNFTDFSPLAIYGSGPTNPFFIPIQFFRAHHADVVLQVIETASPAVRPLTVTNTATNGTFTIQVETATATAPFTNFSFTYRMSGGAVNGIDYTNIPGTNLITASFGSYNSASVDIWPTVDYLNRLNVEAIMTLNLGPGYLVSTNFPSAVVEVDENFGGILPVQFVTNVFENIGMGYHPISNSLVLSVNDGSSGNNFAMLDTNFNLVNWSGVFSTFNEVDLAIVQTNASGFSRGDMFFADGFAASVGKLSADGTTSNLVWATALFINPLENSAEAGFCIDQTGIFSNNLVMATVGGGIYVIDAATNVTPYPFLQGFEFEGVTTVPNDTNQYGPWAGKILAGAETTPSSIPLVVTADTNKTLVQYQLNISTEDIHIIPTNQDFYFNDFQNNRVLKLPRHWLTNYVGDVLFTEEGVGGFPADLVVLHWDGSSSTFIKHRIPTESSSVSCLLEQGTFAPINFPASPLSQ